MNDDITILADFDSALYEQVEPPLVSLYLPTHGSAPGDESDRIEFEALVEQARAKLAQDADVFELPAEKIPGDSGIAALYRY